LKKFSHKRGARSILGRTGTIIAVASVIVIVGVAAIVHKVYNDNLQPVSNSKEKITITIDHGSTTEDIAQALKSKGVIKSDWAFELYVKRLGLREHLKAGAYVFTPSQSVSEIVELITDGKVATDLVTILPGKRLEQIKEDFIESGFSSNEVESAFNPKKYANHPALTDKPKKASLEGYLYPESFHKTSETTVEQVIMLSLDEMQARLTPEVRQAFSSQGLSVHEAITLASIIELEVSNEKDRATVAQVFLKRLKEGMPLQSDATNAYAELDAEYDTYQIEGLPPGPVSNAAEESLQALAYPSQTDWLYFVSGDDGKTYFSKTLEEHEELTRQHCTELCNR
jgi:UPF0755 protein